MSDLFEPKAKDVDVDRLAKNVLTSKCTESAAHVDLMLCAGCWLEERGFSVVFRNTFWLCGGPHICPDVYGRSLASCTNAVVEAKISRSDFFRSLPKYRKLIRSDRGVWSPVAEHHFIIVPKGLIKTAEIPNCWGLLEVKGDVISISAAPTKVECRMKVMNRTPGIEWDLGRLR